MNKFNLRLHLAFFLSVCVFSLDENFNFKPSVSQAFFVSRVPLLQAPSSYHHHRLSVSGAHLSVFPELVDKSTWLQLVSEKHCPA